MNTIIYTLSTIVINFIKNNNYYMAAASSNDWFLEIDCDDEFLSLIKLKFGDEIQTYKDICNSSELSYYYARTILKERFLDGEAAIASVPANSYLYATNVFNGRFLEGEAAIATDAKLAYYYAEHVLRGRFLLGEETISCDSVYRDLYNNAFGTDL